MKRVVSKVASKVQVFFQIWIIEKWLLRKKIDTGFYVMHGPIYFQCLSAAVRFELFTLLAKEGPLTLRELLWMAEAHSRQAWNHTASVICVMANAWCRGKDDPAFTAEQFHPYLASKARNREPDIKLSRSETLAFLGRAYGVPRPNN